MLPLVNEIHLLAKVKDLRAGLIILNTRAYTRRLVNMGPIQNLAVFGATGNLGSVVVPIIAKHFNITVLRRIGSSSQPPSKFKVIDVDYSSREQLEAALVGQDAVLSLVASAGHHTQPGLADAAAAAGVKRFIHPNLVQTLTTLILDSYPSLLEKLRLRSTSRNSQRTQASHIHSSIMLHF